MKKALSLVLALACMLMLAVSGVAQTAGTYTVLMQATTDQGVSMNDPVALRLVVEE